MRCTTGFWSALTRWQGAGTVENSSGVTPIEYKVVVLPDPIEEVTQGGIIKPGIVRDREKHRTVKATLIAVGGNAFEDCKPPIPQPGDRVYVAVAAGIIHEGPDGEEYRLVNDKDIVGIIKEPREE
jgi:chaperonin GroES